MKNVGQMWTRVVRFYGAWYCKRCGKSIFPRQLIGTEGEYYWYIDAIPHPEKQYFVAMPMCGCGMMMDYDEAE